MGEATEVSMSVSALDGVDCKPRFTTTGPATGI